MGYIKRETEVRYLDIRISSTNIAKSLLAPILQHRFDYKYWYLKKAVTLRYLSLRNEVVQIIE